MQQLSKKLETLLMDNERTFGTRMKIVAENEGQQSAAPREE
jgi:hypothetical protein